MKIKSKHKFLDKYNMPELVKKKKKMEGRKERRREAGPGGGSERAEGAPQRSGEESRSSHQSMDGPGDARGMGVCRSPAQPPALPLPVPREGSAAGPGRRRKEKL